MLEAIRNGEVRLQFRRWRRPTVKAGGTLNTALGVLSIESVDAVTQRDLTLADAHAAGFATRKALMQSLEGRDGRTYRVTLQFAGADPRIALRARTPSLAERQELFAKLDRMDRASRTGPWTRHYLQLIASNEGVRAPDLAAIEGIETAPFKARVRRLKALGLTESLEVGYRISPRGRAMLVEYLEPAT